jgi:hypothetical protein
MVITLAFQACDVSSILSTRSKKKKKKEKEIKVNLAF